MIVNNICSKSDDDKHIQKSRGGFFCIFKKKKHISIELIRYNGIKFENDC